MSFDTACKIIKSEMQFMRGTTLYERIDFRFLVENHLCSSF